MAIKIDFTGVADSDPMYEELLNLQNDAFSLVSVIPIEDAPAVWDATCEVRDGIATICGGLGPGGRGSVMIKLPVEQLSEYYDIELAAPEDDYVTRDYAIEVLIKYGALKLENAPAGAGWNN